MVAPTLTELIIIAIGFGVVGLYMLIVHKVVKSSEAKHGSDRPAGSH